MHQGSKQQSESPIREPKNRKGEGSQSGTHHGRLVGVGEIGEEVSVGAGLLLE